MSGPAALLRRRHDAGEIAEAMGVSRATVNSYLADARRKRHRQHSIEPARLASLTIAQELKRHFGLTDCLVVPSDDNARPLMRPPRSGRAQALPKLLKSGDNARRRLGPHRAFGWRARRYRFPSGT